MKNRFKMAQWGIAAVAAVLMFAPTGARADITKCQQGVEKAVQTLQGKLFLALFKCKDAIRKEIQLGATSGLGTTCGVGTCVKTGGSCRGNDECPVVAGNTCKINSSGAGCMANAAKTCEAALCTIYGIPGTECKSPAPGDSKKTEVGKFRASIEKLRTANSKGARTCEDADLGGSIDEVGLDLGHLLSGTPSAPLLALAPPIPAPAAGTSTCAAGSDCAATWMEDWLLFATEKYTIKTQLMTVADMLALFQDAVAADPGPHSPTGTSAKTGTSCTGITNHFNALQQAYRPNLCRFGVECRDHVCALDDRGDCSGDPCDASGGFCDQSGAPCQLSNPTDCNHGADGPCDPSCGGSCNTTTGNGTYVQASLTVGLDLNVPIFGSLAMEVCRVGRANGICQGVCTVDGGACLVDADCGSGHHCTNPAPGAFCSSSADCISPAACNLGPGEGAGAAFLTQGRVPLTAQAPSFLYLINQPSKTIFAGALPSTIQAFIQGICVGIDRSEGWCDCTGAGMPINYTACQQHVTTTGATTDDCGATIDPNNGDSVYPGTVNGKLTLHTAPGGSAAGDCLDMVQVEFSALTSSADLGPDGLPCTGDDVAVSTPPLQFPLTTGTATAQLKSVPSTPGHCSVTTGTACVQNVNCPSGETCVGAVLQDYTKTATGQRTTCANYLSSNLSGVGLTGAIPLAGLVPPSLGLGDVVAAFHFGCK